MYKRREKFIFLLAGLLVYTSHYGQEVNRKEYKVSDTLPELRIGNMLNYSSDSLSLSDIKGKLIILDFWNTSCRPCIESFPVIDSLQESFKTKVQFVLVNKESKDSTLRFFAKRKKINQPKVPMATGDKVLGGMFPTKGYPYHIWISEDKVIQYISFAENTTQEQLNKYLAGEELRLTDATKVETNKTMVEGERTEYYSFIARCQEDINIGKTEKISVKNGTAYKISENCTSILNLFKKAYREYDKYWLNAPYSVQLTVKDEGMYVAPPDARDYLKWQKEHGYSYELQVPQQHGENIYAIMQEDLKRFFKVTADFEKRKVKTIVLVKKGKIRQLDTNGGIAKDRFNGPAWQQPTEDSVTVLINQPFEKLTSLLGIWFRQYYPFFNKVKYKGNIDISLTGEALREPNIEKLNRELKQYGLRLRQKHKRIRVLIIRE